MRASSAGVGRLVLLAALLRACATSVITERDGRQGRAGGHLASEVVNIMPELAFARRRTHAVLRETGIPISAGGAAGGGCFGPTCCCENKLRFDPVSERNAIRGRKQIDVVCRKMPALIHPPPPRSETTHHRISIQARAHRAHHHTLIRAVASASCKEPAPPSALVLLPVAIQPIQPPAVPVQRAARFLPSPGYHYHCYYS